MALVTGEHETTVLVSGPGDPKGGIWAVCSCGYRSTRKRTEALALSSAVHHRQLVARELRANGVAVPTFRRMFVEGVKEDLSGRVAPAQEGSTTSVQATG